METEHIESFHQYLNTINSSIQFTKEIEVLSASQNLNWASSITSTKHYKTMDFLDILYVL